jgi:hypothetical protein
VYWVTHAGLNELDIPLLLRPTSETAMYPMFAVWIRSHGDLPLKIYQIVNTFRYETKQTRAFIRVVRSTSSSRTPAMSTRRRSTSGGGGLRHPGEPDAEALPAVHAAEADGVGQVPRRILHRRHRHGDDARPQPAAGLDTPLPGELLPAVRHQVRGRRRQHQVRAPDHLRYVREAAGLGGRRPRRRQGAGASSGHRSLPGGHRAHPREGERRPRQHQGPRAQGRAEGRGHQGHAG